MEASLCWWCLEPTIGEDLVHLEGARLAGSPELRFALPADQARRIRVCRVCALEVFVTARMRLDVERAEAGPDHRAGISPTSVARLVDQLGDAQAIEEVERLAGRIVADAVRKAIRASRTGEISGRSIDEIIRKAMGEPKE